MSGTGYNDNDAQVGAAQALLAYAAVILAFIGGLHQARQPRAVESYRRRLAYFISDSPYKIYKAPSEQLCGPWRQAAGVCEGLEAPPRAGVGRVVAGIALALTAAVLVLWRDHQVDHISSAVSPWWFTSVY
jgi:hypothetical protein